MIKKVYAMRDSVVECFDPPFLAVNRGDAVRGWQHVMRSGEKNKFTDSPGDYTLFEIGEFDLSSGVFSPYSSHERVGSALEFIPKEQ